MCNQEENKTISNVTINDKRYYYAQDYVTLGSNFTANSSTNMKAKAYEVKLTGEVQLKAGAEVEIKANSDWYKCDNNGAIYINGQRKGKVAPDQNEFASANVRVFPNPSTGFYSVELDEEDETSIRMVLHDVLGKAVLNIFEGITDQKRFSFDIGNLEKGIYFLKVNIKGQIITKKLSLVK